MRWLKTDLQRDVFRQDLLCSFGSLLTVCRVSRHNALPRGEAVIKTGRDPGYDAATPIERPTEEAVAAEDAVVELTTFARDLIERRIATGFTGHQFAHLVAAVLRAQGSAHNVSKEGADKGSGIVAGRGGLGLESPRR